MTKITHDITSLEDVKDMVNRFYGEVREDALIGPIFNAAIKDRWPEHLEKMYRFWQTVLFDAHTYHGSPFLAHVSLPLKAEHFTRWLELFYRTIDAKYVGINAERAKLQGKRMAEIFYHKLTYNREDLPHHNQ